MDSGRPGLTFLAPGSLGEHRCSDGDDAVSIVLDLGCDGDDVDDGVVTESPHRVEQTTTLHVDAIVSTEGVDPLSEVAQDGHDSS